LGEIKMRKETKEFVKKVCVEVGEDEMADRIIEEPMNYKYELNRIKEIVVGLLLLTSEDKSDILICYTNVLENLNMIV